MCDVDSRAPASRWREGHCPSDSSDRKSPLRSATQGRRRLGNQLLRGLGTINALAAVVPRARAAIVRQGSDADLPAARWSNTVVIMCACTDAVVPLYQRVMSTSAENSSLVSQLSAFELQLREQDAKLNQILALLLHLLQTGPKTGGRQIGFVVNP